jgi:hypothetical protein
MESQSEILYRTESPLTFLTWLENQTYISEDYNKNLQNYQDYVTEWHRFKKSTEEEQQESFASLYIDLLRDITLTYATEEEKRFIGNCDFTKPEELDIILPFFIQKLKTIILYYSKKREDLKKKVIDLKSKGTDRSIKEFVKGAIFEEIESENLQVVLGTKYILPDLKAINENINIKVYENYDDTEYYNKRSDLEEINVNSDLFLNFRNAVTTAIKKYPVFLEGISSSFSLNLPLTGNNLNLLKRRDFIDYYFSNSLDNVKLLLYRDLTLKFMGCDMYYLSTNSTSTEFITGRLFNIDSLSGNKPLNPVNKRFPTYAAAPSIDNLFTAYECGKFFVPSKVSAIEYNTFNKTFTVNRDRLSPDKVIVFPDPKIIGNAVDGSGESAADYPLTCEVEVSFNKEKSQNAFKFGDIISGSLFYNFYPYESYSTTVYKDEIGISNPYDDITFWSGEKDTEWTNDDIWPGLDQLEKLPIDERLDSLLIDQGHLVKWFFDYSGNEYGLFKKETENLIDKKNSKGVIYVKTTDKKIKKFEDIFNTIYEKLPSYVAEELKEPTNLYIKDRTILLETENYVVIDIINYNAAKQEFISSFYPGFYRKKYNINSNLEKFIGFTYREDNNSLYLCFTTLNPELSSTNYKSIIPLVFKLEIDTKKIITVYPNADNTVSYSLSANAFDPPEIDIKYIDSGHFSYKEKYGLYNCTYMAFNLNNVPFVVNEKFYSTPYSERLITTNPVFYKPFLYIYDTNFSYHEKKGETGFSSFYTDYAGSYGTEIFKFHRQHEPILNYTTLNTLVINQTGSYNLNFDWSLFDRYNFYVGCSSFGFTNGSSFLLFSQNNKILNDLNTEYLLFDFYKNDYLMSVFGRLNDSSFSSMTVTVRETFFRDITATNVPAFTGTFCEDASRFFRLYDSKKFDDSVAVGTVDPAFINTTGTTFLYFDWTQYNQTNIFIGCSSFNINFVEDILVVPQYDVLMLDENQWYDLFTFKQDNREFFAKIRTPYGSDKKIAEVYVGEVLAINNDGTTLPPFTGIFCDSIYSIFKTIEIVKVGNGKGIVTSRPSCVICGDRCDFLYPIGSTISFRASAEKNNIFTGWLGGDCEGSAGDCFLTVTENTVLSAVFISQPDYELNITINIPATVVSSDGSLQCVGPGRCEYLIGNGAPITLEASPAPEGYVFRGFIGGKCDPGFFKCGFFMNSNVNLTALYEPGYADVLVENVFQRDYNTTNIGSFILGRNAENPEGIKLVGRYPGFEDRAARGVEICEHNSIKSPGTTILSVRPDIPIYDFHIFEAPTSKVAFVSSNVREGFNFGGYISRRCEGSLDNYCDFLVTDYITVTSYFTPPFVTLSILNYPIRGNSFNIGNITTTDSYNTDNRSNIQCNSINQIGPCVGAYLSGTEINIKSVPSTGSFVHLLCGSNSFYLSSNYISGVTGVSGSFALTESTTLSVFSEVISYKTITIYKSAYPVDLLNTVVITPGPSATPSFTMGPSVSSVQLVYPTDAIIEILPLNSTLGQPLLTLGSSGLKYFYTTLNNSILTIDPNPTFITQTDLSTETGLGVTIIGTAGPLITEDKLVNIDIRDSQIQLTQNATLTCFFVPISF